MHFAGAAASLLPAVRTGGWLVSTLVSSPDRLASESLEVTAICTRPRCYDKRVGTVA